ncbi:hypothetical protein FRC09_018365, partial [Ceratobasidium sp. 395]
MPCVIRVFTASHGAQSPSQARILLNHRLGGLELLKVGERKGALGAALDWCLWVGHEATRESVAPVQTVHNYPSPAHSHILMSLPS